MGSAVTVRIGASRRLAIMTAAALIDGATVDALETHLRLYFQVFQNPTTMA